MNHPVIWTRAADEWEHDRDLFGPDLKRIVRLPCLRLKMLPAQWPSLAAGGAPPENYVVCFTSQKAVEAVPDSVKSWIANVKQVMTFGEQTQQAILTQGWTGLRLPAPGGQEFARLLVTHLDPYDRVLICAAQDPAYPVADDVRRAGFPVEQIAVYATEHGVFNESGQDLDEAAKADIASRLNGAICFASPSSVRGFVQDLGESYPELYGRLRAVAIGETTASQVVKYFTHVKTVAKPQRSLLFQAARDWDET